MAQIQVLDNALDYNIPVSEDASAVQNLSVVFPEADTNIENLTNHITDDLSGTVGKSATVTLDGSFPSRDAQSLKGIDGMPERYILQDDARLDKHMTDASNGSVEDVVGYANRLRVADCLNQKVTDKNSSNPQAWAEGTPGTRESLKTMPWDITLPKSNMKIRTNIDVDYDLDPGTNNFV